MLGHGAISQLAISEVDFGGTPAEVIFTQWFSALSEPVRVKRGTHAARQQFLAAPPFPPIVSFGWMEQLSEPVRTKPGLRPGAQQFIAFVPNPVDVTPFSWFSALSEPVRVKPGLRAAAQQFLAAPTRLLPTPTVFGTLSALETKDVFLAGASVFNPPASAEIGIAQPSDMLAAIGVAVPTVASARISIRILPP